MSLSLSHKKKRMGSLYLLPYILLLKLIWGCGCFSGLFSHHPQAFSIALYPLPTQLHFESIIVVPVQILIQSFDKVLNIDIVNQRSVSMKGYPLYLKKVVEELAFMEESQKPYKIVNPFEPVKKQHTWNHEELDKQPSENGSV